MDGNNFEDKIKEMLYHHEEVAPPNLMDKINKRRTPLYVLRNKVLLNKYRLLAASVAVGFLLFLFGNIGNWGVNNVQNEGSHSEELVHSGNTETNTNTLSGSNVDEKSNPAAETDQAGQNLIKDESIENAGDHNSISNTGTVTNVTSDENASGNRIERSNARENQPETVEQPQITDPSEQSDQPEIAESGQEKENMPSTPESDDASDDNTTTGNDQVSEKGQEIASDDQPADNKEDVAESGDMDNEGDNGGQEIVPPLRKPGKWSISLAYGAGIGGRSFEENTDESRTIDVRNESEKQLYSHAADLSVSYKLSDQLEVYSGLNYFNRREKMSFERVTESTQMHIDSREVIEYHPIYGPRTVTLYDTSYQTLKVKENLSSNNSYRHVTVPLGLKYTLYYGEKLGFYMNGNMGLEVYTKTEGVILDGDLNEVNLSSNFSRTRLGTSLSAGMGVVYRMNDRMFALFEPRATLYLSPVNNDSYRLNQLDQVGGLYIGLKYGL